MTEHITAPNLTAPSPSGSGPDLTASTEFADDDGTAPPEVAAALAARGHGAPGAPGLAQVVATLARHRLLVPLLEVDGDLLEGDDTDPCAGSDRAVAAVSLRTEDGAVGLAFTSMAALHAWDPDARPMPTQATRVAAALLAEGGVALRIDPAGPHPMALEGPALARLATGEDWPSPWRDPAVQQAIALELAPALAAGDLAVRLDAPSDPQAADLLVELRMAPDLSPAEVARRARIVAERLTGSAVLRSVFDGVLAVAVAQTGGGAERQSR